MPDVILPALDEADALAWVLPRIPAGFTPIVVDNGSTDATADVARRLGAHVVEEPRTGYGAACHVGLEAAASALVCVMDADGSMDPADLTRVAAPVAAGHADLVLGARRAQPGAWPWHARLANRILAVELRRRTGAGLTDLGPMRCARREELLALGVRDRRSGYPLETVLRAAAAGWRLAEVEIAYRPRAGGRSKVTGSVRGTAFAVRDMAGLLR